MEDKILETMLHMLFCIIRELLFEVPRNLRLASMKWSNDAVFTYYYFNGEIDERDRETLDEVDTRFMTRVLDREIKYSSFTCIRVDEPNSVLYEGECFFATERQVDVYRQRQKIIDDMWKTLLSKQQESEKRCHMLLFAALSIRFLTPKNLRLASLRYDQNSTTLSYYFDGQIKERDKKALNEAGTRFFGGDGFLDVRFLRVDEPSPVSYEGECFFARKELYDSPSA